LGNASNGASSDAGVSIAQRREKGTRGAEFFSALPAFCLMAHGPVTLEEWDGVFAVSETWTFFSIDATLCHDATNGGRVPLTVSRPKHMMY